MKFIEVHGHVVGTETWSQTRVSGTSSGMSYKGIGTSRGRTTSTVTNVGQVWVRTEDGKEVAVRINPDRFATREGHQVSILARQAHSGPHGMVAGYNHSTADTRRESTANTYSLVIVALLAVGWIPVMLLSVQPVIALVLGGLLLWPCLTALSAAARTDKEGAEFVAHVRSHGTASTSLVSESETDPTQPITAAA